MSNNSERYNEETKVENPAIEQLVGLGYTHINGAELAPDHENKERGSLREVVLEKRLSKAIQKLNPWINDQNLDKVVREITTPNQITLMESNRFIYDRLNADYAVEQDFDGRRRNETVHLIDFENPENNEFLVVNQFSIHGANDRIRPDLILFVNGMPLAVIEAKSPYITNPLESGIDQLRRYANLRGAEKGEGAERLFWYNQMMIVIAGDKCRYGTITSPMSKYLPWKDPFPLPLSDFKVDEKHQEILIAGMLSKANFLDIVQNFTVYEPEDGKVLRKIPRYQQYRAVRKAVDRLKSGQSRKDRGGVIWHTQGSGKSLTMVFMATKMRRDEVLKGYKLVFITDRDKLHRQLSDTFKRCFNETVLEAKSVKHFKEILAKDSSELITGMLQKFQENEMDNFPLLNDSEKILVMVDEAHRGHYKAFGAHINTALPNAPKIAFTGTPLIKKSKTENEFGTYIDEYTIEQAVRDGATVQIIYEGRESKTKVTGDSLDKLFDAYFSEYTPEEREQLIRKYGKEQAVLEAPKRIEMICLDMLEHYRSKVQPEGFKAQIVTSSRRAAVIYKETLDRLGAPESAVIISGMHNDEERFKPYTKKSDHDVYVERFKKPMEKDGLSFLIVKDMLLTGFDAPVEQVMYLDRKLREHTLLQAIARVNRTRSGKDCGFIVDYYGLSDYLKEALELFSQSDIKGCMVPLKEELPKLEARHTRVMGYFKEIGIDKIDECVMSLKDEDHRAKFEIDFKKFLQSMNIVMPDRMSAPYIPDMRKLGKINNRARNLYRDEQLNIADAGKKVQKLIDEHIYSTGVDPKIPPTPLFDAGFIKQVESNKTPEAQAAEIEYAIKNHINLNREQDPDYYDKLSKRLSEILDSREENWEQLKLMLLELRNTMETNRAAEADRLGLDDEEFAFFGLLRTAALKKYPDREEDEEFIKVLLDLTTDLHAELKKKARMVDFFRKDAEIKKVKLGIKRAICVTDIFDEEDKRLIQDIQGKFIELAKVRMNK
jgi:type I restriction enzyme R subunit